MLGQAEVHQHHTDRETETESAARVVAYLEANGHLEAARVKAAISGELV